MGVHRLFVQQTRDAVGELDLATGTAADARQMVEHPRHQEITSDDRQRRGRLRGFRLLDDRGDALRHTPALRRHDAITVGLGARHRLATDHAAATPGVHRSHLREHRRLCIDEIVGEMHEERLLAHRRSGAEHGMTETERRRLADVDAGRVTRQHAAQLPQQLGLTLTAQQSL